MALILTFLGKGGTGRTTLAIATARRLARQGWRVLLVTQDTSPVVGMMVGQALTPEPQTLGPNLLAVQLHSSALLKQNWDEVKRLEAEYLRMPVLQQIYGEELSVLPGMDEALALNALREYDTSGEYEVIVYDGTGDQSMLRMLGLPEGLGWYLRRFQQIFLNSDLVKSLTPFVQPITSAVLNVTWSPDSLKQSPPQVTNLLDQGAAAVANPRRVLAYLVTQSDPLAIAQAQYLWGAAQQVNLTVGGVLLNRTTQAPASVVETFSPLTVTAVPEHGGSVDQLPPDCLPDLTQAAHAPCPLILDVLAHQIRLFFPSFNRKQVKLTQYGPELTVEAGDQRRNIILPSELRDRAVIGARFEAPYLTISLDPKP